VHHALGTGTARERKIEVACAVQAGDPAAHQGPDPPEPSPDDGRPSIHEQRQDSASGPARVSNARSGDPSRRRRATQGREPWTDVSCRR
jgi:hypothetical protein